MNPRKVTIILGLLVVAGALFFFLRGEAPEAGRVKPEVRKDERTVTGPDGDVKATLRTTKTTKKEESAVKTPEQEVAFPFDDKKPLEPQLRSILAGPCPWEKDKLAACRERSDEVVSALLNILHDPSAGYNIRDKGLGLLAHLGASSAVPGLLVLARDDSDPRLRTAAIRTLGEFPKAVKSSDIRGLFDKARTEDEKFAAVEVLGNLGDAATQTFLEGIAKSYPSNLMVQLAEEAATKVRVLNSPNKDTELVQFLHQEEHPLQSWALDRIVSEKKSELAHHLREVLEVHRRLPRDKVSPSFEFHLLLGIRDLGQELRPNEKKFIETYSIEHDTALPD